MSDYVIVNVKKSCFNQCFFHIYRCRKYVFAIIDVITQIYEKDQELLRDFVLDLFIYRQNFIQSIYDLSALNVESFYFIEIFHESN